MRTVLALLAVIAVAAPAAAQRYDEGFDDRGYDREDRTPDWKYRDGESQGKGAYYDGGRYGPRGVGATDRLDPWLVRAQAASLRARAGSAKRANLWFRRFADTDRDLKLSDAEIASALSALAKPPR